MIQSLVTSLETSKKLAEIGLKRETVFYWIKGSNPKSQYYLSMKGGFNETYHENDMIPAYTAQEIADELPNIIQMTFGECIIQTARLTIDKLHNKWFVYYYEKHDNFEECDHENLSEALAKMALILHQNGYPLCD